MKKLWWIPGLFLFTFSWHSCSENNVVEKVDIKPVDSTKYYDSLFADRRYMIDTFFIKKCERKEFNGNVLFADHGHIILEKSYGFRSPDEKDSLSLSDKFQLASLSKPFTATAVLMLKEAGKLSLDDTLGKFFKDFPFRNITVKMLLCHRSGLGNYNYFVEDFWPDKNTAISNDSVIAIMYRTMPKPYYLPDQKHDYSNTGFMLLASIVEKVSGEKFENFLQDNIFHPLGMNNTFVFNKCHPKEDSAMLQGFDWKNRRVDDFYQNGVVGDKNVYSTVGDLFLFDQAIYENKLLSKKTWEEAFTPTISENESESNNNYGLGWRLKTSYNGYEVVYHTGWWKGFRSFLIRNLTLHQTIIVLDNMKRNAFLSIEEMLDLANGEVYAQPADSTLINESDSLSAGGKK